VGVLWARAEVLWAMKPFKYGGDMIAKVSDTDCTWNELPWKFEAGTPHIEGVVGLGAALDYLMALGRDAIALHEKEMTEYAMGKLADIPGLRIIGPRSTVERGAVLSFVIDGVHPHDMATFLDMEGLALRAGQHCAQPLLRAYDVAATNRASFYIYNTKAEADQLAQAIDKARKYFTKR
jgi:cysteine desulfurase/selenocysteine lyase